MHPVLGCSPILFLLSCCTLLLTAGRTASGQQAVPRPPGGYIGATSGIDCCREIVFATKGGVVHGHLAQVDLTRVAPVVLARSRYAERCTGRFTQATGNPETLATLTDNTRRPALMISANTFQPDPEAPDCVHVEGVALAEGRSISDADGATDALLFRKNTPGYRANIALEPSAKFFPPDVDSAIGGTAYGAFRLPPENTRRTRAMVALRSDTKLLVAQVEGGNGEPGITSAELYHYLAVQFGATDALELASGDLSIFDYARAPALQVLTQPPHSTRAGLPTMAQYPNVPVVLGFTEPLPKMQLPPLPATQLSERINLFGTVFSPSIGDTVTRLTYESYGVTLSGRFDLTERLGVQGSAAIQMHQCALLTPGTQINGPFQLTAEPAPRVLPPGLPQPVLQDEPEQLP